ncbi:MAG: helix-turn-helix transcriptional regulator [Dyadobacter sp.]|uniref:helix-turn-helix transcriptional regulator n=1 Tax=Dyadobacter sp. TaxID=1914288 RepID=UPI001B25AE8E|nr:helix-turn-helix transcriptional regulator [Dyadobacter sp.]MBO9611749.1 helix-turn-helix transcriptional regulator [Dyadobacter sp.]
MPASRPLTITYKNDDQWFAQVGPQLRATFDEDSLRFDNEIGKGDFYRVNIDHGLRVRRVSVMFRKPVVFKRKITHDPGYYVLASNLSEQFLATTTGETLFNLGYGTENGIYFSSPQLTASYSFEPDIQYHLIFIVMSYGRIHDFISRQPESQRPMLLSFVNADKPMYHVECLDTYSLNLLKEMDQQMHGGRTNNLLIHARCLELCFHVLQRMEERKARTHRPATIHPADVIKMNEIRHSLLNDYQSPCPPVHVAAQRALMSPSKFKTLFRQMFGHSYYQFYKNVRMHKARELLMARQMNVSEVGYMLGYNNISKFTKAFKDAFAVTPGSVMSLTPSPNPPPGV